MRKTRNHQQAVAVAEIDLLRVGREGDGNIPGRGVYADQQHILATERRGVVEFDAMQDCAGEFLQARKDRPPRLLIRPGGHAHPIEVFGAYLALARLRVLQLERPTALFPDDAADAALKTVFPCTDNPLSIVSFQRPPKCARASKPVTSEKPCSCSSFSVMGPSGPAPTTAMRS